jgi:hypothetical protein
MAKGASHVYYFRALYNFTKHPQCSKSLPTPRTNKLERGRERERSASSPHSHSKIYESNRETDISYCPCAPLWSLICHYSSIWFRFINMQLLNLYTRQNSQPILFNLSLTQTIETQVTNLTFPLCLSLYLSKSKLTGKTHLKINNTTIFNSLGFKYI